MTQTVLGVKVTEVVTQTVLDVSVTGVVTDSQENARWVLTGNWCTKMEGAPIIHVEESNKGKPVFETGPHKLLWKVRPPP